MDSDAVPDWLRTALDDVVEQAIETVRRGRVPFAATLLRDGVPIASAVNTAGDGPDPTAHAEVEVVRAGCRATGETYLSGTVLVSSCEPCALCRVVATLAGVDEIVYAAPGEFVPDLGATQPPEVTARMTQLQKAVAGPVVVPLRHVETARAREPFDLFVASR